MHPLLLHPQAAEPELVVLIQTSNPNLCLSLQAAVGASGLDLVIHAAGPFQRNDNHLVLAAAIDGRVPYLDVSDDTTYSERYPSLSPAMPVWD